MSSFAFCGGWGVEIGPVRLAVTEASWGRITVAAYVPLAIPPPGSAAIVVRFWPIDHQAAPSRRTVRQHLMQEDLLSDPSSNTEYQVHSGSGRSDIGRASQPFLRRVSALASRNGKPQKVRFWLRKGLQNDNQYQAIMIRIFNYRRGSPIKIMGCCH